MKNIFISKNLDEPYGFNIIHNLKINSFNNGLLGMDDQELDNLIIEL